jgi:cytoskeletal protein CcmA (bactofilin family)
MFRRKEDSLFDNTTDPNQASGETTETNATTAAQPAVSSVQPAAGASSFATTTTANQPAQPNRPVAEPRPAAPSGNVFRPAAAPLSGDMSRNRMPETKPAPVATPSAMNAGATSKQAAPGRRVLTVGNDILLKGEIATCDRLVIEGKVDATLNDVHTVEIAETGSFKGSAHIEDAEISGLFEGDLIVRNRLVIYATGKVRGKITYGEIEIERGGEMTGEIKTSNPASGSNTGRPRQKDDKAA